MREREQARKRAEELVGKMTLEERASQLRYDAPAIPRLGVPAYNWWNEALHGVARAGTATSFPQAIGMAASFDTELLEQVGEVIAREGRAKYNAYSAHGDRDIYKGLTFWSPNVNIFRDPRWGRGHETYGEDPYLTGALGVAFIKGIQGDGEIMKAAACAKHFAVHSGPEDLRHEFDAEVSEKDLWETYLPAFEACVKEGEVEAVMGAYNRTNGEPCCGHSVLMEDILRGKWGFQGHYVSDCWAISDFHTGHMITDTAWESAALALKKGCDVNCGNTYLHILKAYQLGLVTEEEITRAAVRLFTTRFLLGLFDETEYDKISYEEVECRKHREMAQKAACEGMVLLKNNGILPIDRNKVKTIGVIGPNADSRRAMIGNYYGTSSHYKTVLEGIQDEAGEEIRVLYAEGCHLYKEKADHLAARQDRLSEALIVAENSDLVILCVGLDETLEGEECDQGNGVGSGDKADLLLPAVQRELLDALLEQETPVVVCLMTGSAIDISPAEEKAAAVLQVWYPGAEGGKSAAQVLFGKVSPSGKLPVTFYYNEDLDFMPEFTDYSMKGRTYRYLDRKPLYPFGYGLTYGDVQVEEVEAVMADDGKELLLRVKVKNEGDRETGDVVEVYVKDLDSACGVKNFSLCGFCRTELKAGEEKDLEIRVPESAFTIVDEQGKRYRDGNRFRLYVGTSQPDERSFELTGEGPVEVDIEF
ncbi:MAG: glycoside hydrolase family 3 C-terminal domain-containing protein [Clostridiales bacterium]|nr:glycoside hydrolase family 3 C-terminal domain-containing protein [Clostridiales bacterium]